MTGQLTDRLRTIVDPRPEDVGATPSEFLTGLGGPAEIRVTGRDSSRCRVVSALLHGNEPSSVVAVHRWLRSGVRPAVDASIFVMAVEAALLPPGFAQRMPPGRRDLNRCFFAPFTGDDGLLAQAMLARLRARPCEALVDIHNNTGKNPTYGIINGPGRAGLKLVELFTTNCCILSNLRVGALTEALLGEVPCAAVECGHSADPAAHEVACAGVERFLGTVDLALDSEPEHPVALFDEPVRVRLKPGTRLAFGSAPQSHDRADVTLRDDIESHNFQSVARGTVLGWLAPGADWPFEARAAGDREVSREHFAVRGDALIHDSDLVPIMMTTNAQVALLDCLCYLMRRCDWYTLLEPATGRRP